jgi:two-component system response regulator AtoC
MRVLVVDDEASIRRMLDRLLRGKGHDVVQASDAASTLEAAADGGFDVVLLDLQLPDRSGLEILPELGRRAPAARVIMMTAHGSIPSAVQAMREGAWDYLSKPFDNDELLARLRRIEELHGLHVEVDALRAELEARYGLDELVGSSPRMAEVLKAIRKVGPVDATVLVLGESGTGKELVARAIHRVSPRARRPFVPVNCGAIPSTLVEDSFFGHARGAFTDARQDRPGSFEQADGGTLFLDEIAELPLDAQASLLRVLQEKSVCRIGETRSRPVDFRLLAATNVDLEEAVAGRRFREDLFWRLNMITVRVPPLRDRAGDIPALVDHLLGKWAAELGMPAKRLAPATSELLCRHRWPGNVRELENTLYRALVMSEGEVILPGDLPSRISGAQEPAPRGGAEEGAERPLEELVREATERIEAAAIRERLRRHAGHRTRTAASLGIGRKTLFNKMRTYGIGPHSETPEDQET